MKRRRFRMMVEFDEGPVDVQALVSSLPNNYVVESWDRHQVMVEITSWTDWYRQFVPAQITVSIDGYVSPWWKHDC